MEIITRGDMMPLDKRRCKRLPRMLLTENESDGILAELQDVWTAHYADSAFVLDTNDPVQWQRLEPMLRDADENDFQKLGINVAFSLPHTGIRRQMYFSCPGHDGSACRLSIAANCLLEFPSLLARLLPVNISVTRHDIMRFRLWSCGRWRTFTLTIFIPMVSIAGNMMTYLEVNKKEQTRRLLGPQPRYMSLAEPQKNELELWPYYLEKAVAKLLGSYCALRSLTFESAISMLMGCEVISRRITDELGQQATTLLRILTVMQRDSIVFLRQEGESSLRSCPSGCMLHRTDDVYVVLAFKQSTDYLDVSDTQKPAKSSDSGSVRRFTDFQVLASTQLLVRRVCCTPLAQAMRCQYGYPEKSTVTIETANDRDEQTLLDMSDDPVFKERGVLWESAAYLLSHFSHIDMCFFGQDVPPTAEEDLISLNLMPWMSTRISSSWVRGKNSLATGNRKQQSCTSPQFVLELWAPTKQHPILVALTLRQASVQWKRANKIPARMQVWARDELFILSLTTIHPYKLILTAGLRAPLRNALGDIVSQPAVMQFYPLRRLRSTYTEAPMLYAGTHWCTRSHRMYRGILTF
uniref:Calpain catalytic domain-containing protein n=1 Tax=Macrostomum lignano TaxID=282301 RepID=A0A1I8JLI7_9PLAT